MQAYEFLNRATYTGALIAAAKHASAGERVMVVSMALDPSEAPIAELLHALERAAQRGAVVTLIIDAINFLTQSTGVPLPARYRQQCRGSHGLWESLGQLQAAGGHFYITNVPTRRYTIAQAGRSHVKGAVVGNEVFVGGCNLEDQKLIDVMVHWKDETAADTLATWFQRMTTHRRVRDAFSDTDAEIALDTTTTLLLDAGVPRQSLIYDEALRLIDEAEKWLYITCQYFPGGATARHLAAAHARGVDVQIQFSHPRAHGEAASLQHMHQMRERMRNLPEHFFAGRLGKLVPKLHAKVLASEKSAIVGSHNYVIQGVNLGTAELALHSMDPAFALAVRNFTNQEIARAITQAHLQ